MPAKNLTTNDLKNHPKDSQIKIVEKSNRRDDLIQQYSIIKQAVIYQIDFYFVQNVIYNYRPANLLLYIDIKKILIGLKKIIIWGFLISAFSIITLTVTFNIFFGKNESTKENIKREPDSIKGGNINGNSNKPVITKDCKNKEKGNFSEVKLYIKK